MNSRKYLPPQLPEGCTKVLVIDGHKNAELFNALSHVQITTDQDELDSCQAIVYVTSGFKKLPLHPQQEMAWVIVDPTDDFKTEAQRKLDELDWKIIRAAEELISDEALKSERNQLRSAVDDEISLRLYNQI